MPNDSLQDSEVLKSAWYEETRAKSARQLDRFAEHIKDDRLSFPALDPGQAAFLVCSAKGVTHMKRILDITVRVDRLARDSITDEQIEAEAREISEQFDSETAWKDLNVHVVDREDTYLYTPYGEPK